MALSREEVAQKLNAESVAGNLIVGERGDRRAGKGDVGRGACGRGL